MDLAVVERWARHHHGLVPLSRMRRPDEPDPERRAMPSTWAWHRAVRSGQLELLHPGVARLRGAPRTREQAIAAAVLAVPGSMASHRSAAHLWGIDRPVDDPVDLLVARDRSPARLSGVVVHRPRDRGDLGPSIRSNIPATNVIRTLCDLGAVDPGAVAGAVEHALVAGYVRPSGLRALVAWHGRRGRTGVAPLRAAVDAWPLGDKPPDSVLEPAMARLLRAHGLPPARFHPVIARYEVDFVVIGSPLVPECDGWEFHVKDREQWHLDRRRDQELLALGHPTVRFSWDQVVSDPRRTATAIRRILQHWSPALLR